MATIPAKGNNPLNEEHDQIGHTKVRKTEIDVIKGAQQTDQLDALKANALKSNSKGHVRSIAAVLAVCTLVLGGLLVFGRCVKALD